jgi:hypothetical protein
MINAGPNFSLSGEHGALVVKGDQTARLFDGDGNLVEATCQKTEVFTDSHTQRFNILVRCEMPNLSGMAAVYTEDDNPRSPGLCGRWFDPDGNAISLCDWREVVSASGNAIFTAHGSY